MMDLPNEKCFHFQDGTSAKNLNELKDKIERMPYEEFYRHVSESKNDFANWIRYVLRDQKLADDLQLVRSIVETVEILNDYLYPIPAQQHLQSLDDMQSRIEREVFHIEGFEDRPEGEPEGAPTLEIETPFIEEREVPIEPEQHGTERQHENDRDADGLSAVPETAPVELSEMESPEPARASQARPSLSPGYGGEFHHDVGKIIVKDFIWGLLVGLIIGFILGRTIGML